MRRWTTLAVAFWGASGSADRTESTHVVPEQIGCVRLLTGLERGPPGR
jgi:hypothetical protein